MITSLTIALAAATSLAASCPAEGPQSPASLHREWILEGWERREGDPPFVFRQKLSRFYDFDGKGVVIHDSFDPQKRVARSATEYGSFFEVAFNGFRSARHAVTDGPSVIVGRDLATSALEFVARLETPEGKVSTMRAQSQTVWRCTTTGWRIVREQNAVSEAPRADVERAIATRGAGAKQSLVVEPSANAGRIESPPAQLLRQAFARWASGATDFFDVVLAPDVRWTIKGSGPVAKTYTSRQQFISEAVTPFGAKLASPVRPTVRQILENETHVAVVWDGEATTRDGKPYRNSYVWIFRMDGTQAREVTAFLDLAAYYAVLDAR